MTKRVVYLQKLKPGAEKTYRRLHRRVWPQLTAAYRRAGFTDLSCFVKGRTLAVYIEYDSRVYARNKAWLAKQDIERRWQAIMNQLKDRSAGSRAMAEVFRLPPFMRRVQVTGSRTRRS